MFKVVNGFPCTNNCEVALARKNVDPKNPHNDPLKARALEAERALRSGQPAPLDATRVNAADAVQFGGSLASRLPAPAAAIAANR